MERHIYWRTDHAGPKPPDSWQAVYENARKAKGLVYQGSRYEGLTVDFLELLYSAGGRVLSDDGKHAAIDSDATREVLTFMREGVESGAVPKAVMTYKEEEARRAFESGKATYMRNWPYAYSLGQKSKIADRFKVTTIPSFDGAEGTGVLGGFNLAVSAYSKNPEGALAFINFATSSEQQVIQATKAALPPVLTDVYDDARVRKALPFASKLLDAVQHAQPRPVSAVYPQISDAIATSVYAVLQGDVAPDEAAKVMSDQIEEALSTF